MIIPIILGVLMILILLPLDSSFAEPFNAIKIIEDSVVQVDGKSLQLKNMHERQFLNSPIIKIQSEAVSGELVFIFFNIYNADFVKVMVFDGQFKKGTLIKNSIKNSIFNQESQTTSDKSSILKYAPNLNFEYFISSPVSMQQDFTIQVTALDEDKIDRGSSVNSNFLEKVKIKVELAQEATELVTLDDSTTHERILVGEWTTKKVMEGTTNYYGKWTGGEPLLSGAFKPERWLQVTITATLDEQIVEKIDRVYLIQQTFSRSSSSR